jgi:hypothetical protein
LWLAQADPRGRDGIGEVSEVASVEAEPEIGRAVLVASWSYWEDAMTIGDEERIRLRAHEIWEREGRPDGQEAQHWEQARREIDGLETGKGETAPGIAGIASGRQAGGTIPGGGPGASQGSIGTGGGSTGRNPSGSLKRSRAKL